MITKRRTSYQTIFFSIFLVFLAIGVIGFLIITNWEISQRRAEFQEKIEFLKKEIQILEEKAAVLQAGIFQTESEDYLIKRAQEQGYFQEGAIPVVVLPPEKKEEERILEEKNFWQKFLEIFRRD